MAQRKRRWGILAFVAVGLVLAALLSLSTSAWATPAQSHAQQQTVPIKTVDVESACPGDELVFTITWHSGDAPRYQVVFVDDVNPYLEIDWVTTSHGTYNIVGQQVTVNAGDVAAGITVTIQIGCTVADNAPPGLELCNDVTVSGEGFEEEDWEEYGDCCIDPCREFVPEPGSLLLLASGLTGLAGYAGLRRARRQR